MMLWMTAEPNETRQPTPGERVAVFRAPVAPAWRRFPGLAPTFGDLRLNPCWDDLRGDLRFDKIVAAAKAASR
jgi:hypothetical protein